MYLCGLQQHWNVKNGCLLQSARCHLGASRPQCPVANPKPPSPSCAWPALCSRKCDGGRDMSRTSCAYIRLGEVHRILSPSIVGAARRQIEHRPHVRGVHRWSCHRVVGQKERWGREQVRDNTLPSRRRLGSSPSTATDTIWERLGRSWTDAKEGMAEIEFPRTQGPRPPQIIDSFHILFPTCRKTVYFGYSAYRISFI